MIQQALNGMITLMLAKFILNDVPHAAGLSSGEGSLGLFFHGTYDYGQGLHSILRQGLFAGSSISSIHGQATTYPIILEFGNLRAEPVYYRPGDFKLLGMSGKPKAVYVYPEEFGKPVRTADEINRDLGKLLGELEAQGLPPEEVGGMMSDYPALYRIDRRLGDLIRELNESTDLEAKGIMGRMGGEGVLEEVKKQAAGTGVPVYRIERDEEGEIRWELRRLA